MNAQYSDTHLNPKSGSRMPSIQTLTVNPKSKLNWIESGSKKLKLNRIWFLQTSQMSTSRSPTRQNNPKFMVPDQPNAYHGPRPAKCLHHGPRPDRAILNSWSPTRQSNSKFMVPDQTNLLRGQSRLQTRQNVVSTYRINHWILPNQTEVFCKSETGAKVKW